MTPNRLIRSANSSQTSPTVRPSRTNSRSRISRRVGSASARKTASWESMTPDYVTIWSQVKGGRCQPVRRGGGGEPDRVGHGPHAVDLDDRVQAEPLGERDRLPEVVDRAARARRPRSAARTSASAVARAAAGPRGSATRSLAVLDPGGVGREPRVVGQLRAARGPRPAARRGCRWPPRRRADGRRCANTSYGAMLGCRLPIGRGDYPVASVRRGLVGQRREQRREQVDLDPLPLAGAVAVPQRGQDADRRVQAGDHVDEGDPDLRGPGVRVTGDRHQPADGLHDQVVAGEVGARPGPESGHRAVDEPGLRRPRSWS